mmetsp:Transcript_18493/g.47542  ORF Transcript_18493/g.47542 Transcript_18493/m.47542 type:complete len:252 (-) Transcript_18493:8-763(-)
MIRGIRPASKERIRPWIRYACPPATMTRTPTMATSRKESFFNTRARVTGKTGSCSVGQAGIVGSRSLDNVAVSAARYHMMTDAARSIAMFRTVAARTPTAKRTKPMNAFASPVPVHTVSFSKQFQTLTSACANSSMPMLATMGRSAGSSGPLGRKKPSGLTRSDMLGRCRPTSRSGTKMAHSSATKATSLAGGMRVQQDDLGSLHPSGTGGTRKPRDATVEPTQKTEKHEKPMSSSAAASIVGGWSRVRIR